MAKVYRSRAYDPLRYRLVDAAIGFGIGAVLAVLVWLLTLALWAHG